MNRIILVSITFLAFSSCKESDPEITPDKNQNMTDPSSIVLSYDQPALPTIFEITSTGCPGCGRWGKPTFSALAKEFGEKVIPIAVHIKYGDPFITSTSQSIGDNRYGSRYTPQIWVNDSNGVVLANGGGILDQESVSRMRNLIDQHDILAADTLAGVVADRSANKLTFKIGIRPNIVSNTNEKYLSCYLIEDGLVYDQASYSSNPATHNFVIRQSVDGAFGKPVKFENGSFEYAGAFNELKENGDYHVVTVLWEKINGRFVVKGGYLLKG